MKATENVEKILKMCCRENGRHLTEIDFHTYMLFFSEIQKSNKCFDTKFYILYQIVFEL